MKEQVQKAIESITYRSKKFPEEAFRIISENKELALPYLSAAIEKAILEKDDLDEGYQLHFYALFLLGQFQEKNSFPRIMELASLPGEALDYLLGDAVTSGLSDVLYNTYNGDLELLKETVRNPDVYDYARSGMLDVMGQLYLDGRLPKEEWQDFIREIVKEEDEIGEYIRTILVSIICHCHFVDLLPEIRYLYEKGKLDPYIIGKYEDCIDTIFRYDFESDFCTAPMNAADMLRRWAMFDERPEREFDEKDMKKLYQLAEAEYNKRDRKVKVGRNDPCPCGSGKKYKKCCLNKPATPEDLIENEQERNKWLRDYPASPKVRQEGRIYLEDFYDSESIAIDKMVYLALHHRAIPIWHREEDETVENRQREYLKEAFTKFVQKAEKEEIKSFHEYDEKYFIHYQSEHWLKVLLELLKKSGDKALYKKVSACCKKMK